MVRLGRVFVACFVTCFVVVGLVITSAVDASGQVVRPRLEEIRFEGNTTFPADSLSRAIANRETHCRSFVLAPFCWFGMGFAEDERELIESELPRDMARLLLYYADRGFREARIDTVVDRSGDAGVSVRFLIDEGRPIRISELSVVGDTELGHLDLAAGLPLRSGGRLSRVTGDATSDMLITRMRNAGYPQADVFRKDSLPGDQPYQAWVTYRVEPGPHSVFGPISILGNVQLSDGVIERLLPFREGDEFSEALRLQGQRNLYSVGLVQFASIAALSTTDTIIPLVVNVTEGDVHRVRMGSGWSTFDCGNTEGSWESRNFFRGGRQLQVRARLSNIFAEDFKDTACSQAGTGPFGGLNWLVSTDFTQPWFLSRANTLRLGIFAERQSLQDVFVRKAVGVDVALIRQLSRGTTVTFSYRPQLTTLDAAEVFFCTSFLLCTPEDINSLQSANWLSPLGLTLARDRRNSLLNPTSGYSALIDFEFAEDVTGSDFSYRRIFGDVTTYREGSRGEVLAARLRGGWVGAGGFAPLQSGEGIIHPQKRFFGGGANSVRGFGQNQLGPRVLTVDVRRLLFPVDGSTACIPEEVLDFTCDASSLADNTFDSPRPTGGEVILETNFEFRFPVSGQNVELAFFVDAGGVWSEPGDVRLSDVEVSPGFGMRYFSPIGPIRVDVGYRTRGGQRLNVITSQIRPFIEGVDAEEDRIRSLTDPALMLDYVIRDDIAILGPSVLFEESGALSFSRLQLHFSIGQAF